MWWVFLHSSIGKLSSLALLAPPDQLDRTVAAWTAQVLAANMGFAFEHKPAAVKTVLALPPEFRGPAPVDDDYYYELVALRAFERYGPALTIQQLGEQWKRDRAGSWGSSEQARLLLDRGIQPPDTGHPRYNRLWFTIGPQFSADVFGLLAPGQPDRATRLARYYTRINGHAEAVEGAAFVAAMVSLAFVESDSRIIVEKASRHVDPRSPYRLCLDLVLSLARAGKTPREIANAVEDRWHIEYPATNNAVPNGGIVALSVYFGAGDFIKTLNLALAAADYTELMPTAMRQTPPPLLAPCVAWPPCLPPRSPGSWIASRAIAWGPSHSIRRSMSASATSRSAPSKWLHNSRPC